MVFHRPSRAATLVLVPTPSVEATSTGAVIVFRRLASNKPPKAPMPARTSGPYVARTASAHQVDRTSDRREYRHLLQNMLAICFVTYVSPADFMRRCCLPMSVPILACLQNGSTPARHMRCRSAEGQVIVQGADRQNTSAGGDDTVIPQGGSGVENNHIPRQAFACSSPEMGVPVV